MNKYIGTKTVNAEPITLGEYNKLRGWEIPSNEVQDEQGYLVEYTDGGKPNHPDFKGYISWSPKDVFERSYRVCETFFDRLNIEQIDLCEKMNKLQTFIDSENFYKLPSDHKLLLTSQFTYMRMYEEILSKRIALISYAE